MLTGSSRQISSVHRQYRARDEGGFVRGEEEDGVSHLGRFAEPPYRVCLPHRGYVLLGQFDDGLGRYGARRHSVDADTHCGPLDREVLGDPRRNELGWPVGGLLCLPGETGDRGQADYGAPRLSLTQHGLDGELAGEEHPRPSTAITRSQSSGVASTMVFSGMMPALATSTSMRPKVSTAVLIMRRASSTTETSPTTASTSEPDPTSRSRRRERPASSTSVMTRRASSLANSSAVAFSIPFAAPVTTADFPRHLPSPRAAASVTLPPPSCPPRIRRSLALLALTVLSSTTYHRDARPVKPARDAL